MPDEDYFWYTPAPDRPRQTKPRPSCPVGPTRLCVDNEKGAEVASHERPCPACLFPPGLLSLLPTRPCRAHGGDDATPQPPSPSCVAAGCRLAPCACSNYRRVHRHRPAAAGAAASRCWRGGPPPPCCSLGGGPGPARRSSAPTMDPRLGRGRRRLLVWLHPRTPTASTTTRTPAATRSDSDYRKEKLRQSGRTDAESPPSRKSARASVVTRRTPVRCGSWEVLPAHPATQPPALVPRPDASHPARAAPPSPPAEPLHPEHRPVLRPRVRRQRPALLHLPRLHPNLVVLRPDGRLRGRQRVSRLFLSSLLRQAAVQTTQGGAKQSKDSKAKQRKAKQAAAAAGGGGRAGARRAALLPGRGPVEHRLEPLVRLQHRPHDPPPDLRARAVVPAARGGARAGGWFRRGGAGRGEVGGRAARRAG